MVPPPRRRTKGRVISVAVASTVAMVSVLLVRPVAVVRPPPVVIIHAGVVVVITLATGSRAPWGAVVHVPVPRVVAKVLPGWRPGGASSSRRKVSHQSSNSGRDCSQLMDIAIQSVSPPRARMVMVYPAGIDCSRLAALGNPVLCSRPTLGGGIVCGGRRA